MLKNSPAYGKNIRIAFTCKHIVKQRKEIFAGGTGLITAVHIVCWYYFTQTEEREKLRSRRVDPKELCGIRASLSQVILFCWLKLYQDDFLLKSYAINHEAFFSFNLLMDVSAASIKSYSKVSFIKNIYSRFHSSSSAGLNDLERIRGGGGEEARLQVAQIIAGIVFISIDIVSIASRRLLIIIDVLASTD